MTRDDDLACIQLIELATEYLENTLDTDVRRRLESHLADCPGCERYVAQIRTVVSLLGAMPAPDLSAASRDVLLRAFRTRGGSPPDAA